MSEFFFFYVRGGFSGGRYNVPVRFTNVITHHLSTGPRTLPYPLPVNGIEPQVRKIYLTHDLVDILLRSSIFRKLSLRKDVTPFVPPFFNVQYRTFRVTLCVFK